MLLISYGTRPEWIKIKPLLKELDKNNSKYKLLFTGQHVDLVKHAGLKLEIKNLSENRLDSVLGSIINQDEIFEGITSVMVHGDTTSAIGMALAAFHRKIPIIHLEAGLRTHDLDNPYPEEANRKIIDSLATILLCPTNFNVLNLEDEKAPGKMYITGNTVLDNIKDLKTDYYNDTIVITLHRRENHENMGEWFDTLSEIAFQNLDLNFVIPLHPNPNVQKHRDRLKGINVIDPVDYDSMIDMISNCRFIISDSGGIQEEASFFNKKVIVCRKITERPEAVGISSFMCGSPDKLKEVFDSIKDNYKFEGLCPYGDGTSSKSIVNILKYENYI